MKYLLLINLINNFNEIVLGDILISIANDLMNKVYPLSTFLMPIAFSIVNFIYKERKEISYNMIQEKRSRLTVFLYIITITNIVIYLCFYFKKYFSSTGVKIETLSGSFIVVFSFILLVYSLIHSYYKLLHSINIFKLCEKHFAKIDHSIIKMKKIIQNADDQSLMANLSLGRKFRNHLKKYNESSQIIGQILIAQLEFNIATNFNNTLDKFMKKQTEIFNMLNFQHVKKVTALHAFYDKSDVYKDALNINYSLLDKVSHSNNREETESLLYHYIELIPGELDVTESIFDHNKSYIKEREKINIDIQNFYYKNIIYAYETVSKKHYFEMNNIFNLLLTKSNYSQVEFKTSNIFTSYYVLIMQSVYKNDIKMLTNFVNLSFILMSNQRENIIKDSVGNHPFTYDNSLSKVLISAMVKSIELGHYQCAGFLIKVSVSHQHELDLNKVLFSFKKYLDKQKEDYVIDNGITIDSKDINQELLEEMNFKNPLSKRSFDYCYFKLAFLIKKQQQYLVDMKIDNMNKEDVLDLNTIEFMDKTVYNESYIEQKLKNMHRHYGMMSLDYDS